jgi:hypothetical protein
MFKPIVADMVPKLSPGGFPEYCLDRIAIINLNTIGYETIKKEQDLGMQNYPGLSQSICSEGYLFFC